MVAELKDGPASRGLVFEGQLQAAIGSRWALIIGISKYQDERLNLQFADRDAQELYNLLKRPLGGGFEEDRIQLLLNEAATFARVTQTVRSFLQKPAKEDLVLIYLACHGAPDPQRPRNLYLLPYDTDLENVAGSAVPMEELERSLHNNLLAERIVMLADTCHSAGLTGARLRTRGADLSGRMNQYLLELEASTPGLALLTSAEANESSYEDEKWGGGHGVFTHYLLEGMRGAADLRPKNGIVTVGELFEYVRDNVRKATDNRQHPSIGTDRFDRRLPLAIPGLERATELHDQAKSFVANGEFDKASRLWKELLTIYASHAGAREVKWTPCPEQFYPEFKLAHRLQSQRCGAAPSGGGPFRQEGARPSDDKEPVVVAPQASSGHTGTGAAQCGQRVNECGQGGIGSEGAAAPVCPQNRAYGSVHGSSRKTYPPTHIKPVR